MRPVPDANAAAGRPKIPYNRDRAMDANARRYYIVLITQIIIRRRF